MKKMINRIFSPNVTVIIKLNKYKIIEDTSSGRKYLLRFEFSLICLLNRPNSFDKEGLGKTVYLSLSGDYVATEGINMSRPFSFPCHELFVNYNRRVLYRPGSCHLDCQLCIPVFWLARKLD